VHGRAGGATTDTGLSVDRWAQDALASVRQLPQVHRAGLALPEGGGRRLRYTASDRVSVATVDWCHIDAYDDVPLNTAVRTGAPVLGSLDDLHQTYPGFVERQRGTPTVAVAAVPMLSAGQTVGGYVLFFDQRQESDSVRRQELAQMGEDLGARLRRAQRTEPRPLTPFDAPAPSSGAFVAAHAVAADPAAVAESRRFMRQTLQAWGVDQDTTDTAVLCLSELVTNAVIHARAGCLVRVVLEAGILTTSVRDGGSPNGAVAAPADDPLQVHGRGLQLVDALATRWGSELDTEGTTVWFDLEP
jgi:anti-sigma regulatory factor (Ser/Thr protein kinase)